MDIEEIKKYSKNKIEADDLIKQVRQQIKETTWEKQNLREGFTETFRPLISQFEDPGEDSKKQNIFTQNKEMLRNQLALTEGIRNNQLALKGIKDQQDQFNRALEQMENLDDMEELPGVKDIEDGEDDEKDSEDDKDDQAQAPLPKEDKTPIVKLDLEKNFDKNDIATLEEFKYTRPNDFYVSNIEDLQKDLEDVNTDIKTLTGQINGRSKKQNPTEDYLALTLLKKEQKTTLMKYKNIMKDYFKSLEYKVGQGLYFSPQELLHRFELLNGSLFAGNNGVLPEFIQIAHRLRDLGILSNNQLNTLLRKVI